MEYTSLTAISPIDGRYRKQVDFLKEYFSEYALMKYRVLVEVEYFLFLADQQFFDLDNKVKQQLQKVAAEFSVKDAEEIKKIEAITNHDVKAVEYFLKEQLENAGGTTVKEWVHFGLTSQDINNTSIPLSWKACMENEYLPAVINLKNALKDLAVQWKGISMLAKTHGQPASPTVLGKEIMVFVERLQNQVDLFSYIPYAAKFGGATGNFNAHTVAFPGKDWVALGNEFVEEVLQLQRMQFTTQIEHYDNLAAHFDCIKRINNILIDFCRDAWTYISMEYFKQKTVKGEVGSSAMPHKVNPIDFENAEGNLGVANSLLEHLSAKLRESYIITDYCIGAESEVASVCLFSEVPLEQIRKIILDYQSKTSVALARILVEKYWKLPVVFEEAKANFREGIKGTTAAVVIGDRAFEQRKISPYYYDLAEAWIKFTGLPFVFAAWVANKKLPEDFIKAFNEANRQGLQNVEAVVAENDYPHYNLQTYYTKNISYELTHEKRKGLERFLSFL